MSPASGLALLALAALAVPATLLADGVRALLRRQRLEARQRPLELVVTARQETAGHLLCLTLSRPGGGRLPGFAPGQHLLVHAPAGNAGNGAKRAYSLAAWSRLPRRYELAVKREERGAVSNWAWDALVPGATLHALPPRGDFVLRGGRGELVLIAGGIGITPLRAMLHAALRSGRRVVLIHAARRVTELLYREEFEAASLWERRFEYLPLLSRPGPEWTGERGRLDAGRVLRAVKAPARADFYLCAGPGLMATLRSGLRAAGIAPARLHYEAFTVAAAAEPAGRRIRLGDAAEFLSAGEPTLLASLETHGRAPESECRSGSCGRCRMHLLDGNVRWLVTPELPLAPGEVLPCVCVADGDIRLAAPGATSA